MRKLSDDLWVHEDEMRLGPTRLLLRATFVKLSDGGIWVHSPTPLSPELQKEVAELGDVAYVVAPCNGHNGWLLEWCDAYPDAARYVAKGIPKKVPSLEGYTLLEPGETPPWDADLLQAVMPSTPFFDESVFLHRKTKSLILTDMVQNHSPDDQSGFGKLMFTLLLAPMGFRGVGLAPPLKWGFVIKDKPAFRAFIDTVRQWDFERIIVTHGEIIEERPREQFEALCKRFDL
jgi:hypothetical protein